MAEDLREVEAFWDRWARRDPLWAVLSVDDKAGRRWDLNDFMASGEREIALLWHQLETLGVAPPRAALDFGTGLGRLAQALGRRCARVVGLDISPGMTRLAAALNAYPDRVSYRTCDLDGVRSLPARSFDLVYSNVVLQHMQPETALRYLDELLRLTAGGGTLVFQLPSHRREAGDPVIRPMSANAYQAALRIVDGARPVAQAAETWRVRLVVENRSEVTWRQAEVGSIQIGNQWLDSNGGRLVVQDDGRTPLPQVFPPATPVDLEVGVRAPASAGKFQLRFDVVHEGVSWFALRGSPTAAMLVEVAEGSTPAAGPSHQIRETDVPAYDRAALDAALDPVIDADATTDPLPMSGVPVDLVVERIRRAGGDILLLEDGNRAGQEWVDFRYFVRAR